MHGAYTARELKSAEAARELFRRLGYPFDSVLAATLNAGGINNSPVTIVDVRRVHELFPLPIGIFRSKMTNQHSVPHPEDLSTAIAERKQKLCVDIMQINKHTFLMSRSAPLEFVMASYLGSTPGARAISSIYRALSSQTVEYKAKHFTVDSILTNGEGAVVALAPELAASGVSVNPAGPGQHVPIIEHRL